MVGLLTALHFVFDYVPIGLALTTTALGTLLPILRDNDMLEGKFGRHVLAAGAVGELFPIVAISLFLTRLGSFAALASLAAVAAAALVLTLLPRVIGAARLQAVIQQGRQATAQTTLRWAVVLLLVLLVAAARFGLDVVLEAMLAGTGAPHLDPADGRGRGTARDQAGDVGCSIGAIPIFFVASGMTLNIQKIISNPLRLVVFLVLLLVVRGLPSLLIYARVLPLIQRLEMTFITATTMPLLIALAEIGLKDGVMLPANAAALVGAGVLSVLLYPSAAAALRRRDQRPGGPEEVPAEQREPAG